MAWKVAFRVSCEIENYCVRNRSSDSGFNLACCTSLHLEGYMLSWSYLSRKYFVRVFQWPSNIRDVVGLSNDFQSDSKNNQKSSRFRLRSIPKPKVFAMYVSQLSSRKDVVRQKVEGTGHRGQQRGKRIIRVLGRLCEPRFEPGSTHLRVR